MAERLVLRAPHGQLFLEYYDPEPSGDCQIQGKTISTSLNPPGLEKGGEEPLYLLFPAWYGLLS
ncbi:hypothetical protein LY76DRAFT_595534 [Colletotrichum caudatum]|nr:hypothetical protein LY76DRAFT_595534 [Colletotrichum caudatum]